MSQPQELARKFNIGDMVLYGGAVCRVLGIERFFPSEYWFYMLGAKVGRHKMKWHSRIPEFELEAPCRDNITELRRP